MEPEKLDVLKDLLSQIQDIIGDNEGGMDEGMGEDKAHEASESPEFEKGEEEGMGEMPEEESPMKSELMDYFQGKKPASAPERKGMLSGMGKPLVSVEIEAKKKFPRR